MKIIETPIFTKEITRLLPDEEYRKLQDSLVLRPNAGDLIKGSGGLRKVRWHVSGAGKRGGLRIIYCWDIPEAIFMLYVYRKNEQEDLTPAQLKTLSALMKEWLI